MSTALYNTCAGPFNALAPNATPNQARVRTVIHSQRGLVSRDTLVGTLNLQRNLRLRLVLLVISGSEHRPGQIEMHIDVIERELVVQSVGEPTQRLLARTVRRVAEESHVSQCGRHEDDFRAFLVLLDQLPGARLYQCTMFVNTRFKTT